MSPLDTFRSANPAYAHLPDPALGNELYTHYYMNRMTREQFDQKLNETPSQKMDVDWNTIQTIESHGDPKAVGPKTKYGTAKGDMQVIDMTAKKPGFGVAPAKDNSPSELHRVGVQYWEAMKKNFNGDAKLAAMGYNWGVGNVEKWLSSGADWRKVPPQTKDYLKKLQTLTTDQKPAPNVPQGQQQ